MGLEFLVSIMKGGHWRALSSELGFLPAEVDPKNWTGT